MHRCEVYLLLCLQEPFNSDPRETTRACDKQVTCSHTTGARAAPVDAAVVQWDSTDGHRQGAAAEQQRIPPCLLASLSTTARCSAESDARAGGGRDAELTCSGADAPHHVKGDCCNSLFPSRVWSLLAGSGGEREKEGIN